MENKIKINYKDKCVYLEQLLSAKQKEFADTLEDKDLVIKNNLEYIEELEKELTDIAKAFSIIDNAKYASTIRRKNTYARFNIDNCVTDADITIDVNELAKIR